MASILKRETSKGTRWYVRWWDPDGTQRRKIFTSGNEARQFSHDIESDKHRGVYVDPRNKLTVAQAAHRWAESRVHRASTAERVAGIIRCHIEGTRLGDRPIVQVRESEVRAWINDRAGVLAPTTLRVTFKVLRAVFLDAIEVGDIVKSPAASKRLTVPKDDRRVNPRRQIKPDKIIPLEVSQVQLLAAAMPERHRAMILTQAGLGLRAGELLALRVGQDRDVDMLRRVVHITEQVDRRTRERVQLKTERSRRDVPLPSMVAEALSQHIAAYPPGEDGLIFTSETTGRALCREVYYRAVARAVRKANLPAGTSSHSLRHHYVSVLLDAGESVVTVAERIGDTSTMVLQVYGHMLPNTDERTRKAVDNAWRETSTTSSGEAAAD